MSAPAEAPGRFAGLRSRLPEPIAEAARLALARTLERRVRRSAAVRGAALVFHAVGERPGDPDLEIDPPLARSRLERAARHLVSNYAVVHAGELPAAARARRPGEPVPIAITFDDDLPSHADQALPALRRTGATATAFLCGARAPFWWQSLQVAIDRRAIEPQQLDPVAPRLVAAALERSPGAIAELAKAIECLAPSERDRVEAALTGAAPERPPMLDAAGVVALAEAGWELGFHTRRHYLLSSLDDEALRRALERATVGPGGALPRTLAYPHGKAAGREAEAARELGYVAAFTGLPEVFTDRTDIHLIGRLQPDMSTRGRFALALGRALATA